jgi:5-methylcytosine-specific restriction enzyme A
MRLFYHHVGSIGAREDFPKTVTKSIPISLVEESLKDGNPIKPILLDQLREKFPEGFFNCWGVPSQASIVISNLQEGDVVLLVESVNIQGTIPFYCDVNVFIPDEMRELSYALWGNDKFPYIFFFETQKLNLLWIEFLDLLGYSENFDPRGKFYSVAESRLEKHGGTKAFVSDLLLNWGNSSTNNLMPEQLHDDEGLFEGSKKVIVVNAYERNPIAREKCINHYGNKCSVCGFDFQEQFGDLGRGFIHVHHIRPLSNINETYEVDPINDLRPICPNCHAMIHRMSPIYSIDELKRIRCQSTK